MQTHQPRARQRPLGGSVTKAVAKPFQHGGFMRIARRPGHVPALAADRYESAPPRGQQAGYTQAGAGAEHGQRRPCNGGATADLAQFGGRDHGQRQGQRSEVVDDLKTLETEISLQGGNRERPIVVSRLHAVTHDRVGDRDGAG